MLLLSACALEIPPCAAVPIVFMFIVRIYYSLSRVPVTVYNKVIIFTNY